MCEPGNGAAGRASVQEDRVEGPETAEKYRLENAFSFVVREISKIHVFQKYRIEMVEFQNGKLRERQKGWGRLKFRQRRAWVSPGPSVTSPVLMIT